MTDYFTACLVQDQEGVTTYLRDTLHHAIVEVSDPCDAIWLQKTAAAPAEPELCCSQPGNGPKVVIHSRL